LPIGPVAKALHNTIIVSNRVCTAHGIAYRGGDVTVKVGMDHASGGIVIAERFTHAFWQSAAEYSAKIIICPNCGASLGIGLSEFFARLIIVRKL
jgi:hypothetical protein